MVSTGDRSSVFRALRSLKEEPLVTETGLKRDCHLGVGAELTSPYSSEGHGHLWRLKVPARRKRRESRREDEKAGGTCWALPEIPVDTRAKELQPSFASSCLVKLESWTG